MPGNHHYYLNVDRCAYGGATKLSADDEDIPNNKQICGPLIFAVNYNCSAVYYYQDPPYAGWKQYQSVKTVDILHKSLKCTPSKDFN